MMMFVNSVTQPLSSSPDLFGGSMDGMDYPNKSGNDVRRWFDISMGMVR